MSVKRPGAVTDLSGIRTSEITLDSPTGRVPAYAAQPTEGAAPGLIVIHEGFGMNEHIRDVTRRFAAIGYSAVAPDLYHKVGSPDPSDIDSVLAQMFALPDADATADLEACVNWLQAQPGCTGKVGVIGFCSGGRHSLLAACTLDLDAAVYCWGGFAFSANGDVDTTPQRPTPPAELAHQVSCPMLLVGGTEDQNPTPAQVGILADRLRAANVPVEVHMGEAGHAFFADYRPTYNEAEAFRLWDRVQAFLGQHLS